MKRTIEGYSLTLVACGIYVCSPQSRIWTPYGNHWLTLHLFIRSKTEQSPPEKLPGSQTQFLTHHVSCHKRKVCMDVWGAKNMTGGKQRMWVRTKRLKCYYGRQAGMKRENITFSSRPVDLGTKHLSHVGQFIWHYNALHSGRQSSSWGVFVGINK